jgi:flagellar basal-body rod protein FlgC
VRFTISSPGHPAADAQGILKLPNVNPVTEMAGLRAAMGAYESNLKVMATLDDLNRRTVDLLKI